MKALSLETTKLLDKLYNLRGKDSVILVEMDKQKDKAEKTLERTTEEKSNLQEKIAKLETQHEELENQGEKLKDVLSGIDRTEFSTVLDSLKIDFDPEALAKKVNENLPKTIEKVSNEMKTAEKELVSVEEEMNNSITTIQELGIRKDAALANQDKLNEYFDLALNGKINITRDSITSLLEQFDFSEEEQREAAKILMFPEDALYIYDNKINNVDVVGKSISDVINEAKDAIDEDEKNNEELILEENKAIEEEPTINNIQVEEPVEEPISEEAIFNPFVIEDTTNEQPEINILDDIKNELNEDVNVEDYLNDLGFNYLDFSSQDLDELKENFDKETFKTNVELMKNNNIDLDIFTDHSSLLYDKELAEKVQILLNIGKEPIDIYLNPSILVKYTTEKLRNAIALLTSNGMDPKNVPLMAY
jgi:hypothetical protein